ncbi:MAG: serine hydrolase domain-containing protein [Marinagarivorans sp.]
MSRFFNLLAWAAICASPASLAATLPDGFTATDIGDVGISGSADYINGKIVVSGAGADISGSTDAFTFISKPLSGDGEVTAKIENFSNNDYWAKVGLMIRNNQNTNSAHAHWMLIGGKQSIFEYRKDSGAGTASSSGRHDEDFKNLTAPTWLKLIKKGNEITAYSSADGKCWNKRLWSYEKANYANEPFPSKVNFSGNEIRAGVAITSHIKGQLASATVSNLSVVTSLSSNINAACDRAQVDGTLDIPTNWISPPARFGDSRWDYTNTQPIGTAWTTENFALDSNWTPNASAGFGDPSFHNIEYDVRKTDWGTQDLWLRKKITLNSQSDIDSLMFWGRWKNAIEVYINGVLANQTPQGRDQYVYLGLSKKSRALLKIGSNTIAIHSTQTGNDRYFDIGVAREIKMAQLPISNGVESIRALTYLADLWGEYVSSAGISGSTIGISKNGTLALSRGYGYSDKKLTTTINHNAFMRLASTDKMISEALLKKMMDDGWIRATDRVFVDIFPKETLAPPKGMVRDANIDRVTISDLIEHKSGLSDIEGGQTGAEYMYKTFEITADQFDGKRYASWLLGKGIDMSKYGIYNYNSSAYSLLRIAADEVLRKHGTSFERYLSEVVAPNGMGVAYERLPGRKTQWNEPAYISDTNEPWDRWIGMENAFAIGATNSGFAAFFAKNAGEHSYDPITKQFNPLNDGWHGHPGAMEGSWSIAEENETRRIALFTKTNSGGFFNPGYDLIKSKIDSQPTCLTGDFVAPSKDKELFIQSYWRPEAYINKESMQFASTAQASIIEGSWWVSAKWKVLEKQYKEAGITKTGYLIFNAWSNQYLYLANSQVLSGPLSDANSPPLNYLWSFESLGDISQYKIKSLASGSNSYLNIEATQARDMPFQLKADGYRSGYFSYLWSFCEK